MPSPDENFPHKNDRTFHQRCLSRARDEPAETPLAPATCHHADSLVSNYTLRGIQTILFTWCGPPDPSHGSDHGLIYIGLLPPGPPVHELWTTWEYLQISPICLSFFPAPWDSHHFGATHVRWRGTNPGSVNNAGNIFPCGYCGLNVGWSMEGVCCDNCSVWFHCSCADIGKSEYSRLNQLCQNWDCFRCCSRNSSTIPYSYNIEVSNNFSVLEGLIEDCVFSPSTNYPAHTTRHSPNTPNHTFSSMG